MLEFRHIEPTDFERVFDIWHSSVQATHDFLTDDDRADIATQVKDLYIPNTPLILGVRDGTIVGFMGMTDNHIDALFIDPDYMDQGIGKAFIQHARTIIKGPLSVDVNEQNEDAHRFYEKMGFTVTSRTDTDSDGRPYPTLYLRDM